MVTGAKAYAVINFKTVFLPQVLWKNVMGVQVFCLGCPESLSDREIVRRIAALYTNARFAEVMKKWNNLSRDPDSAAFRDYRASFLRRMWNASEFMKTLKQHYTMSFNGRRGHHGTMWESRYRVRVKDLGEFGMMMAESGYVDANPVNAGMAVWPDGYEWWQLCRGM